MSAKLAPLVCPAANGREQGTQVESPHGSSPGATGSSRHGGRKHRSEPFFIGVAGGTASGKTTVCDQIIQRLHGGCCTVASGCRSRFRSLNGMRPPAHPPADQCVVMLSQDSFYRGLTPEEHADVANYK